jgi:hypothetical protein
LRWCSVFVFFLCFSLSRLDNKAALLCIILTLDRAICEHSLDAYRLAVISLGGWAGIMTLAQLVRNQHVAEYQNLVNISQT